MHKTLKFGLKIGKFHPKIQKLRAEFYCEVNCSVFP